MPLSETSETATKQQLRNLVRERCAAAGRAVLECASARAMEALEKLPEFVAARTVALYWSLPGEVSTHGFAEKWRHEKRILLPVMHGDSLLLRLFTGEEQLSEKRFGVQEPNGSPEVDPREVDLIVVPGMGFDPQGGRLGHGKGFYDRLLRETPALKTGVCFDFQLFGEIPAEPHDIAVDRVIAASEESARLYICAGKREP